MRQELFEEVFMAMEINSEGGRELLRRALEHWAHPRNTRRRALSRLALSRGLDDSIVWAERDVANYPEDQS